MRIEWTREEKPRGASELCADTGTRAVRQMTDTHTADAQEDGDVYLQLASPCSCSGSLPTGSAGSLRSAASAAGSV